MIDEAAFDTLRSFGDEFLAELADRFTEDTEAQLELLRTAFEAGDAAAVGRIAHYIKGSAAQLGGRALASACDRLERKTAAGDATGCETDVRAVELEYERLRLALRERLASSGAPS